ncbi:nucleostemin 4 [Dermatophagoides pteronyssinus]|uniref:nucleostemin 4 n=1 Tax=Dermatophagoides pteronyssinus TaxID=6956 RepID=UPI003F66A0D1
MPQGRRKIPFSNKQKKAQLQAKRDKKNRQLSTTQLRRPFVSDDGDIEDELDDETLGVIDVNDHLNPNQISGTSSSNNNVESNTSTSTDNMTDPKFLLNKIHSINAQRHLSLTSDVNRYALQFFNETDQEIRERKERAQRPLPPLDESKALVCSVEDMFGEQSSLSNDIPVTDLDMPKRPPWSPTMTAEELYRKENDYFLTYLMEIFSKSRSPDKPLSYFDMNLETWRQLWRVIEMSDIILLVADIRHPIFHFPPSLYHYVVDELGKDMILVLNKIDLVDAELVLAWHEYLKNRFPRLNILEFASYAGMKVRASSGKRVGKLRMAVRGALALQEMVAEIVGDQADLSSWRQKIESELNECENVSLDDDSSYYESEDDDDDGKHYGKKNQGAKKAGVEKLAGTIVMEKADSSFYRQEHRFKDGIVTIGCVGHPNVGKSSLMNALYGKKVVSVSRTPGHTKHFQTIFLTDKVRLCDCPGLVFPSRAPKELQVLMGCYPISQLREPYTAVGYLAQRINLVRLLRLQHPEGDTENIWSAYDICEGWAEKRGFRTARTNRPDIYRAANSLLRIALDGRTICLAFQPTIYQERGKDYWSSHSDKKKIEAIQNLKFVVEEQYNKNLNRGTHGQGYVDSHASSVEADVDDDDDSGDIISTSSKFVLLEVDDVEAD